MLFITSTYNPSPALLDESQILLQKCKTIQALISLINLKMHIQVEKDFRNFVILFHSTQKLIV